MKRRKNRLCPEASGLWLNLYSVYRGRSRENLKRKHYMEKKVKNKWIRVTCDLEEKLQHPSANKYKSSVTGKPQEIRASIYFSYNDVSSFLTVSEVIFDFNPNKKNYDGNEKAELGHLSSPPILLPLHQFQTIQSKFEK